MSIHGDFSVGNIVIGGGKSSCFLEYEARSQGFQSAMPGKLCCTGLFANSGNGDPELSICLHRVLLSAPGDKAVNLPAFLLKHTHVMGDPFRVVCNPSVLDAVPLAVLVKLGEVNGGQAIDTIGVTV